MRGRKDPTIRRMSKIAFGVTDAILRLFALPRKCGEELTELAPYSPVYEMGSESLPVEFTFATS